MSAQITLCFKAASCSKTEKLTANTIAETVFVSFQAILRTNGNITWFSCGGFPFATRPFIFVGNRICSIRPGEYKYFQIKYDFKKYCYTCLQLKATMGEAASSTPRAVLLQVKKSYIILIV